MKSVFERVTERILERLEEGVIPWQSPHMARVGFPKNFHSGRDYRGINVFLLGMAGYTSPYFLTYQQAKDKGGQVRKGEKGYLVIKYGTHRKKEDDGSEETRRFLRLYTVFNSCQIDGIDFPHPELPPFTAATKSYVARAIVSQMPNPPAIHEGRSVRTCYDPQTDIIDIPHRSYFTSEERFYKSLFHEMVHSTGAAKRLARKTLMENRGMGLTNKSIYSREELVAEMGTAFLCAHAGIVIDDHENSAAYLQSWLKVLRTGNNRQWIFEAAGHAQRAADYILRFEPPGAEVC
ncbi:antirestriction protein ArdC [Haloferula luteola]|uniref:Antirestriction protein ArdC n=1 Tax=Haloferula luteola TaxID=595692 RepID=A0A840VGH7_9BACT|nr:ArdC-like ssDNA-binding domain-containing protein [Haloferula luteola]MBB5353698.1 antirestriction protein ArdC [Haloferula luteola]